MSYEQTLVKIIEPVKRTTLTRMNRGKKWKYVYNKEHDPHKHEGGSQHPMSALKKRPVMTPVSKARKEIDRKNVTVSRPGMRGHRTISRSGSGPDQPKHRKAMRGSGMFPKKGFQKKIPK